MSEFSTIIIKTSATLAQPPAGALVAGELAYSFVSGKLFIGVDNLLTYPTGYRIVNDSAAELSQAQLDAVAALIADETAARTAAIAAEATVTATNLATEVSTLVNQMGLNAQAASDALTAAIATEVVDRNDAITAAITQEVADRNDAITAAIAAENIEQIRIDVAQKVEQSDIDTAITAEVTARDDAIAAEATVTASNLAAEVAARTAAIAAEATVTATNLAAEVTARGVAIDALRTEITGVGGTIDSALLADKDASFNNLTVTNLVVNGTTTTVNSEQTLIKDPVIELGINPDLAGDNYARGVKYHYADGGIAKTGFFGVSSTERDVFEFIPNESAPGVLGTFRVNNVVASGHVVASGVGSRVKGFVIHGGTF